MDHNGDLNVGYIEGDGIGLELIPKVKTLVDEVVAGVYQQQKRINWVQLYLGEQGAQLCDGDWFPEQTLTQLRELKVALKGPMSSAVGGGFRSLNIALREELDLFATIREIKSLPGLPSPLANANGIDWVIIRECSEDSFASIELAAGTPDSAHLIDVLENELGYHQLRFVENCGLAIKNCSKEATERLLKCALTYAQKTNVKKSLGYTRVTLGNSLKGSSNAGPWTTSQRTTTAQKSAMAASIHLLMSMALSISLS